MYVTSLVVTELFTILNPSYSAASSAGPRPRTIKTEENAHKYYQARQRLDVGLIVFVSVFIGFYAARNENAHKHNQARQRFCLIVSGKTEIFCLIVFVSVFIGFYKARSCPKIGWPCDAHPKLGQMLVRFHPPPSALD